ncbi:MAG: hypothetical protein ACE5H3_03900, partial [Planctomycetota bacterium]
MLPALSLAALSLFQGTGHAKQIERTWVLPRLGLHVRETRFLDRNAGTIRRRAFLADGTRADLDPLRARERELARMEDGVLAPELRERRTASPPGEVVPVVYWLET